MYTELNSELCAKSQFEVIQTLAQRNPKDTYNWEKTMNCVQGMIFYSICCIPLLSKSGSVVLPRVNHLKLMCLLILVHVQINSIFIDLEKHFTPFRTTYKLIL